MIGTIRKIIHFPTEIKRCIADYRIRRKVTLQGTGHKFKSYSGVMLLWGSTKEDVTLMDHAEVFGIIMSYNHGKVTMGKWAKLGKGSVINCVNNIYIDDDTAIADNVTIVDHNFHPSNPDDRRYMRHTPHCSRERQPMYAANAPVHIGKNVMLGSNVRVCKGVTIGDNSIIGAGAVVTKNIPANCIAVGNPARVVKENIDKTTTTIFPLN